MVVGLEGSLPYALNLSTRRPFRCVFVRPSWLVSEEGSDRLSLSAKNELLQLLRCAQSTCIQKGPRIGLSGIRSEVLGSHVRGKGTNVVNFGVKKSERSIAADERTVIFAIWQRVELYQSPVPWWPLCPTLHAENTGILSPTTSRDGFFAHRRSYPL